MNVKIKAIKCYQAVEFDRNMDSYFTRRKGPRLENLELSIVPNVGISIKNEKDWIIVPYPNIAMIRPDSVEVKPKVAPVAEVKEEKKEPEQLKFKIG